MRTLEWVTISILLLLWIAVFFFSEKIVYWVFFQMKDEDED